MYPWGHAAVAYLCYALLARRAGWSLPRGRTLLTLLVASQAADLVDKPLAYYGVLVSGRSLSHSLVLAALVVTVAVALGRRFDAPRLAAAAVVGHLAHVLGDAIGPAAAGEWTDLGFLLYPAVAPVVYPADAVPPWVRVAEAVTAVDGVAGVGAAAVALAVALGGLWSGAGLGDAAVDEDG